MLHELALDRIDREPFENIYAWTIHSNWPDGGTISFGASGYTQTLQGESVLLDRQKLTRPERERIRRGDS
jgi:hypothetical protein